MIWIILFACAGSPTGGAVSDTGASGGAHTGDGADGSDGTDGTGGTGTDGTDAPSPCPAAAHDPSVPVGDYDDYPVFIEGTDRRFVTIQDGIWGAEDRDVVVVCPGLYKENIDFKGKVIRLTTHAGPAETVLDGGGVASTVSLRNWEPPETVLEGFTILGGNGSEFHGGGVFVEWGSPTIRYNVVTANRAGIAGGVYVRNGGALVHNNIIVGNDASEGGGGIVCTACVGAFRYNTMVANTSRQGHVGEYFWGAGDFVGNILVAHDDEEGYAFRVMDWREDRSFVVTHNLLWPDTFDWAGSFDGPRWDAANTDALRADPLFVDPNEGDYRLQSGSPAVDAGPASESDPDGSPADLGAYGGPDGAWPWG